MLLLHERNSIEETEHLQSTLHFLLFHPAVVTNSARWKNAQDAIKNPKRYGGHHQYPGLSTRDVKAARENTLPKANEMRAMAIGVLGRSGRLHP